MSRIQKCVSIAIGVAILALSELAVIRTTFAMDNRTDTEKLVGVVGMGVLFLAMAVIYTYVVWSSIPEDD